MPRGGGRPNTGGKRPGAGRPKGSHDVKTRAVAAALAEQGITPLEVICEAMWAHYQKGELDAAASLAKDAAPYMHARLSAVQVGNPDGTSPVLISLVEVVRSVPGSNGQPHADSVSG